MSQTDNEQPTERLSLADFVRPSRIMKWSPVAREEKIDVRGGSVVFFGLIRVTYNSRGKISGIGLNK